MRRLWLLALLSFAVTAHAAPGLRHASYSVLSEVPTHEKVVALTIDLGESATRASFETLFKWLTNHRVKATFFITGWFVRTFPDLTHDIVAHGYQLGNHTDTHPHCPRISNRSLEEELHAVEELLRRQGLAMTEPRYFRPPFGEYNQRVVDTAAGLGYRTVMWSVTGVDYNSHGDPRRWASYILRHTRPGAIILTHATPVSAAMVPVIVTTLQAEGYRITTLSDLVNPSPVQPHPLPRVRRVGDWQLRECQ